MAHQQPRCALIVEDEIFFLLAADMRALGFDICELATKDEQAANLALRNRPHVILMDVNLEGIREGIEVARWLYQLCEAR
jgi:CheY-like chemotaxis protein